jgi:hypothetical protein
MNCAGGASLGGRPQQNLGAWSAALVDVPVDLVGLWVERAYSQGLDASGNVVDFARGQLASTPASQNSLIHAHAFSFHRLNLLSMPVTFLSGENLCGSVFHMNYAGGACHAPPARGLGLAAAFSSVTIRRSERRFGAGT